jgi:hypothetical protein
LTGKLPALLLLAPALLLGQAPPPAAPPPPPRKNSVLSLLQPNSVLSGVLLPRYDENRRLTGVFRAKTVTLVTQDLLDGKTITMELYHPDRSPRGRLDLTRARYDQKKGTIRATETAKLAFDNLTATGTGLVFVVDRTEGFLAGPVTTRIKPRPKTAMSLVPAPRAAAALLSASLLPLPTVATAASTPATAAAPADPAPAAARMAADQAAMREQLRTALTASAAVTEAATKFLEAEELLAKTTPATPQAVPEPKALDVEPGPEDAVISCDGGMYFDTEKDAAGEKGVLVYLGNVAVTKENDYLMTGANELKAFFTKKPEPPAPADGAPAADGEADGKADGQWELDRIVATGAVYFKKFPIKKDEDAIEASGAIFTYTRDPDRQSDEFILSGGKPWAKQGGIINRAKRADQTIRIQRKNPDDPESSYAASFSPGGTETILTKEALEKRPK